MEEEWRAVKGYEGLYEVSNLGRVRSFLHGEKILKASPVGRGYLTVELWKNKKNKRVLIHRLVAQTFIPNPNNYPQVNHKDEDKSNNMVDNLEWCTPKYNMNYGWMGKHRHELIDYQKFPLEKRRIVGRKNAIKKPVLKFKDGKLIARYECIKDAAIDHNIAVSCIARVANGERKTSCGFEWMYDI